MRFRVICSSTWDTEKMLNLYPCLKWYHHKVIDNTLYITLWELGEITELMSFTKHSVLLTMGDTDNDYIPTIEIVDE